MAKVFLYAGIEIRFSVFKHQNYGVGFYLIILRFILPVFSSLVKIFNVCILLALMVIMW